MQSEMHRERADLEVHDATYEADVETVTDVLNQSLRVDVVETTYIPCVLTQPTKYRVLAEMARNAGHPFEVVTRAGLRAAVAAGVLVEVISKSHIHRYGSHLNGVEAVAIYGPVAFEVRTDSGSLLAVIDYAPHPAFGSAPVRAEVRGVVR